MSPPYSPKARARRSARRAGALCLLLCLFAVAFRAPAGTGSPLPAPVERLMRRYHIPLSSLGVYVREVNSARPLLQVNADIPRNPASVMKVLTTWTSLASLGPDHRWMTSAWIDGRLRAGRLRGDLILQGGGDPHLVIERFWRFLDALRARGLREIDGDVIIDDQYLDVPPEKTGAFDDHPNRNYNALPSALLVNFASTRFLLQPDPDAGRVNVVTVPPASTLHVDNRLRLTAGRCRDAWYRIRMGVERSPSGTRVLLAGRYPDSCGDYSFDRAVLADRAYTEGVFRRMWKRMGGTITGRVRAGSLPPGATLFYRMRSSPLALLIRDINKWSNNVMTRTLLLDLGAARFGPPGTEAKGIHAITDWLRRHGVPVQGLVMKNGSGLTRLGRVTPRTLGVLLTKVWHTPLMPEFISSLPINGVDGTMKDRLRRRGVRGRMHIKTGLIDNVRSMAGFVLTRSGRTYVVVTLQNYPNIEGGRGTDIQNALLRWLVARH